MTKRTGGALQEKIRVKGKEQVKMGSNDTSEKNKSDILNVIKPIYYMCKICGLLPVKFMKSHSGMINGKIDKHQVLYGIFVMTLHVGLQYWGLYRELRDGWEHSTRLSSKSAIAATCIDVQASVIVVVAGIIGAPCRWQRLQIALNKIIKVDQMLNVPTSKHLRKFTIIVIIGTYFYLIVLTTMDFIMWNKLFKSKRSEAFNDKGPQNYFPVYSMYIIIITYELHYTIILLNVGEIILKINSVILKFINTNKIIQHFWKHTELAIPSLMKDQVQTISYNPSDIGHNRLRTNKFPSCFTTKEGGGSDTIDQLITVHGIVCDSIVHINKAYGGSLLMGTISCLIHLIITPYFLYNEIFRNNITSSYILLIQVLWIIFHLHRLLLLIQPCHMITTKIKNMSALISQALIGKWRPEVKKQLEIFSIQLLQRPIEFTACGLFSLDRSLVTSIVGTVTTYLVILLQFQKAGDTADTKTLLNNATELLKNVSSIKITNELTNNNPI